MEQHSPFGLILLHLKNVTIIYTQKLDLFVPIGALYLFTKGIGYQSLTTISLNKVNNCTVLGTTRKCCNTRHTLEIVEEEYDQSTGGHMNLMAH